MLHRNLYAQTWSTMVLEVEEDPEPRVRVIEWEGKDDVVWCCNAAAQLIRM